MEGKNNVKISKGAITALAALGIIGSFYLIKKKFSK
jgi:hypothetical protein